MIFDTSRLLALKHIVDQKRATFEGLRSQHDDLRHELEIARRELARLGDPVLPGRIGNPFEVKPGADQHHHALLVDEARNHVSQLEAAARASQDRLSEVGAERATAATTFSSALEFAEAQGLSIPVELQEKPGAPAGLTVSTMQSEGA